MRRRTTFDPTPVEAPLEFGPPGAAARRARSSLVKASGAVVVSVLALVAGSLAADDTGAPDADSSRSSVAEASDDRRGSESTHEPRPVGADSATAVRAPAPTAARLLPPAAVPGEEAQDDRVDSASGRVPAGDSAAPTTAEPGAALGPRGLLVDPAAPGILVPGSPTRPADPTVPPSDPPAPPVDPPTRPSDPPAPPVDPPIDPPIDPPVDPPIDPPVTPTDPPVDPPTDPTDPPGPPVDPPLDPPTAEPTDTPIAPPAEPSIEPSAAPPVEPSATPSSAAPVAPPAP